MRNEPWANQTLTVSAGGRIVRAAVAECDLEAGGDWQHPRARERERAIREEREARSAAVNVFCRYTMRQLITMAAACAVFLLAISSQTWGPAEQAVAERAAAGGARRPIFPLAVEPLWQNGDELWGFAFLIEVAPFGAGAPPQLLMVDTGSSTLAFCNASLAQGRSSSIVTLRRPSWDLIACNNYGSGTPPEFFWVSARRDARACGRAPRSPSATVQQT